MFSTIFKGIGSILFLKNDLKKIFAEKELYIARCFPNVLDFIVLENVNLSEDKIGRLPFCFNDTDLDFCHQSVIYPVSCIYLKR
jgi:hypothetical protein